MLLNENGLPKEEVENAIFIDRDPLLFRHILNYLRSRKLVFDHVAELELLILEAEFFGLTKLYQQLYSRCDVPQCGGCLFQGVLKMQDFEQYGHVTGIDGSGMHLTVAQEHVVTSWSYSEATGWSLDAQGPILEQVDISQVALNHRGTSNKIAFAAASMVHQWETRCRQPGQDARPYSPPPASIPAEAEREETHLQFDLTMRVDAVFFVSGNLVALSKQGKIGVRNVRTNVWQVQDVDEITCYGHAGSLLLFGSSQGKLFLFDLDKFPLRLKDNDLLINLLYTDPDGAAVTALSVYESTVGSEKCMEIAYGTQEGVVRIIVQHPETIGQPPMLYQTYRVHRAPILKVVLSSNTLISVCKNSNHVRSWRVARFRGRISTQPGTQGVSSFSLPTADRMHIGPFGDLDQDQVFVQSVSSDADELVVRLASSGEHVCDIQSVDGSAVTTCHVHEGGMASRVGSRSRRFLCTGHLNGQVQLWDLTAAIGNMASEGKPAIRMLSSTFCGRQAKSKSPQQDTGTREHKLCLRVIAS